MNRYFKIVVLLILPFLAFGQKFRSEIQDYNSVVNLRNETLAPKKNDKAFIQTTKHLYSYDWGNTTSSDDGLKYIVQTSGSYRWVCLNCHLRVELSQDSILLQYDANNVLVQRDTIRLASSGIVGAAWDASAPQGADGDLVGIDGGYLVLPTTKSVNNIQIVSGIIERGNTALGGSQPADFTRNTYNWLGGSFQDKWQSSGDANLFDIKANQTVNAANTTNSGEGAVNVGTIGANGQYKLNVGGAIWLNNGRNTTIIGNSAAISSMSSGAVIIGSQAAQNTTASDGNEVLIGFQVAQNSDCKFGSTVIGARSAKNATNLGGGLTIIGGDAANAANLFNTSNHVFIGSQCAARIKTQFSEGDIAIGVNSGSDFNGRGFTLIGSNVARFAQGVDVTYIGRESALNLVGNKNTITGSASANTTISGNNLSIFGAYSYQNAIGDDNSIFGHDNSVYVKNMSFSTILGASSLGDMGFNGTGSDGLKSVYETTIIGSFTGNTYKGNTLNKVISLGSQNFNSFNNTQDFTNMMFLGNNISEVPLSQTSNRTILGFNEVPVFDVTTANTTLPSPVLLGGRYMYQETGTGILRIAGGTGKIAAIQGVYQNDADAASNGVQLGQCYELSSTNTYGMPEGILKTRKL
jgi:hypothetical protein